MSCIQDWVIKGEYSLPLFHTNCYLFSVSYWIVKRYSHSNIKLFHHHLHFIIQPARKARRACAVRALGLWLADGALTVLCSGEGEDFLKRQPVFFFDNGCNSGTESRKIVLKVGNERSLQGRQTGRWPKLGSYGINRIFRPKTEILGPKKKSLLSPHHVLATTRKSCSKKKDAFSQINISP